MVTFIRDFLSKEPGAIQIALLAVFDLIFLGYILKNIGTLTRPVEVLVPVSPPPEKEEVKEELVQPRSSQPVQPVIAQATPQSARSVVEGQPKVNEKLSRRAFSSSSSWDNLSPSQAKVIIGVIAVVITLVTWKIYTRSPESNPLIMKTGEEVLAINGIPANQTEKIAQMNEAMAAPDSKLPPILVYKMKRPDGSIYEKKVPMQMMPLPKAGQ